MNAIENFILLKIQQEDEKNISNFIPKDILDFLYFTRFLALVVVSMVSFEIAGASYVKNNMFAFFGILTPILLATVIATILIKIYVLNIFKKYATDRGIVLTTSLSEELENKVNSVFVTTKDIYLVMDQDKRVTLTRPESVKSLNEMKSYLKTVKV